MNMNEWMNTFINQNVGYQKGTRPNNKLVSSTMKAIYITPTHSQQEIYPQEKEKIPKWHSNVEYLLSIKLWGTILHCKFPRSATGRVTCASFKSIRQCSIGWQQDMCAVLHVPSYCDFDRTVSPTVEQMAKILWNTLLAITGWSIIISNLVGYL